MTRPVADAKARFSELRGIETAVVVPMAGKSDDLYTDAMIAATAHEMRLTLVTRNTKDFVSFGVKPINPFLTLK